MNIQLHLPLEDPAILKEYPAGTKLSLSGVLFTARDQAHKRLISLLNSGQPLPLPLKGNLIYYCGPTPARHDNRFGAAGPTTASRMDPFTVQLLKAGLAGTIGKGGRSKEIREACQTYAAPYFMTFGGAGAYLASKIIKQKILAFPELGTEAIYQLEVQDFPVVVAYDTSGNSIY